MPNKKESGALPEKLTANDFIDTLIDTLITGVTVRFLEEDDAGIGEIEILATQPRGGTIMLKIGISCGELIVLKDYPLC